MPEPSRSPRSRITASLRRLARFAVGGRRAVGSIAAAFVGLCLVSSALFPSEVGVDLPVRPDLLSQEMKDWLARKVPTHTSGLAQQLRLLEALQKDDDGPRLSYREGYTGTAIEAFEAGEVNCLSFSQIVVAMARELGADAFYMDVRQFEQFTKEGDLVVVAGHMTAGIDEGIERRILEFSVGPDVDYRDAVRISDATAYAYYHSNRGAEELQAGEVEKAKLWLRAATEVDPLLPDAWANLGVALRRSGEMKAAEAAYRRAVDLDPDFFPAYQNLVALFRMRGDPNAADLLLEVLGRQSTRNPFVYLALGDLMVDRGDWPEAMRFYRRGRRLRRSNPDLVSALGRSFLALGNRRKAEKLLAKALEEDPENARARRLERELRAGEND